jgi:hypothetical protein
LLPTTAEKLQNFFGLFLQFHIGVDTVSGGKQGVGHLPKDTEIILSVMPEITRFPLKFFKKIDNFSMVYYN